MTDEKSWIELARNGNKAAFSNLVRVYQTPVFNLAYRMLGNPQEAEEAAQEAFLRAYTRFDRYDPSYKFSTWLLSITSHYCIDKLRKRRLTWLSLDEPLPTQFAAQLKSDTVGPEKSLILNETQTQVQALLETLKPEYRTAVILRYWYDLSYEEIAEMMDTTVSAIKSRLFRARKMMAESAQTVGIGVVEQ